MVVGCLIFKVMNLDDIWRSIVVVNMILGIKEEVIFIYF